MLLKFISLEWKAFFRSASFKINLALKILLGFIGLYFAVGFLMFGYFIVDLIKEMDLEVFSTINQYVLYYLFTDLVVRFMFQKLPVTSIRPLLALPISKRKIALYTLGKSFNSYFVWSHLFLLAPLAVRLIQEGYNMGAILLWTASIFCFITINNLLNILLQNKTSVLLVVIAFIAITVAIHYYTDWNYLAYAGAFFTLFYSIKWLFLAAIIALLGLGYLTYRIYIESLYIDSGMAIASKNKKELSWLQSLNIKDPFLQNDIRLLLRNKRSRSTLFISLFFLAYGLFFYKDVDIHDVSNSASTIIFSIIITGGFIFTFGQYVPSWDSAYYPLFMTQNVKYKAYLDSKWKILVLGGLITSVLSLLYLFIDTQLIYPLLAAIFYNIGINSQLALLTGAFIRTPIDLAQNQNIFGDKQAFNFQTLLINIPMYGLPILIYIITAMLTTPKIGFLAIGIIGLSGILMKNYIFDRITGLYKKHKYITLQSYKKTK